MTVECPACGRTSQDPEFCDYCNADLAPPPDRLPPRVCPLPDGPVELTETQRRQLSRPNHALELSRGNGLSGGHGLRRVRWIPSEPHLLERLHHRLAIASWALPPGVVWPDGHGVWLLHETTGDRFTPWYGVLDDPLEELTRLLITVRPLVEALEELHRHGFVWLNFDPDAIERDAGGRLRFTNLDLGVFPFQQCPERVAVRAAFAAPEIVQFKPDAVGPRTDVFHLALYCWYWLAGLLPDGLPGSGLDAFQYELPALRLYQPHLPEGIEVVLRQGLAVAAEQRFTTPSGLLSALREAGERAHRRRRATGAVRWEIGKHTRPGRTKAALGRGNEDQVLSHRYADPERALVAVADGISSCDVGSGALASLIMTMVLDNAVDSSMHAELFPTAINEVCRRGAQTLVDWAIEKGYRDQLKQGADLMGTTLTAGWLEGRHLCIGNLGDSRAYLVDGPLVEQLTVDGDLGNYLLRHGGAPEQLRELGALAKALRQCVGGCTLDGAGQVVVQDDSCIPTVTHWPLLAGDVIVVCSDGLVDEGTFLEPETLGELVRAHKDLPAQELAERLADAADAMQRLPTFLEPEGFGDNISCIVIKIHESFPGSAWERAGCQAPPGASAGQP
jgi:serine/threonine protein phosphatase PrpC